MKQIIFLLLVCISTTVFSQKIDIDKEDNITVDGAPLCKLIATGNAFQPSYSIQDMEGNELILIDESDLKTPNNTSVMSWMFTDMDKTAFVPLSIPIKKTIAKTIVKYKLIQEGQLNEDGVRKFCNNFKDRSIPNDRVIVVERERRNNKDEEKTTVEPKNKNGMLLVVAENISLDGKKIAKYKSITTTRNNMPGTIVTIYDAKGKKIADAAYENFTEEAELSYPSSSNRKREVIEIPKADAFTIVKAIAKYLLDNEDL